MSMLVFKILKASASFHGVDYNDKKQNQGNAALIHFQNFGHIEDGRQQISKGAFKKYFENYSKRNERVKNKQFHAILSCKGSSYTHIQLKDHAMTVMEKLGYSQTPMLIYAHSDTSNNHLHIITSRIDANGQKINDRYEGRRANEILNNMLKIDTKQQYFQHLDNALAYKFSTYAQAMLLMEREGYSAKDKGEKIHFYKYGKQQGSISKKVLDGYISQYQNSTTVKRTTQIRALIGKYKSIHSPELRISNPKAIYEKSKQCFNGELTDFLKTRFGLEFIFFASAGHDKPYGYAIIDHNEKTIYKGGDIVKLEELLCQNSSLKHGNELAYKEASTKEYDLLEKYQEKQENAIEMNLSKAIDAIERQAEADAQKTDSKLKRSKKNRFI